MDKNAFLKQMAKNLPKGTYKQAEESYDAFMETIIQAMTGGETLHLKGFGKFEKVIKKACVRRNPKTDQPVNVPAKTVIKFTLSKNFIKV